MQKSFRSTYSIFLHCKWAIVLKRWSFSPVLYTWQIFCTPLLSKRYFFWEGFSAPASLWMALNSWTKESFLSCRRKVQRLGWDPWNSACNPKFHHHAAIFVRTRPSIAETDWYQIAGWKCGGGSCFQYYGLKRLSENRTPTSQFSLAHLPPMTEVKLRQ